MIWNAIVILINKYIMIYKIISFLFSWYVNMIIYDHTLYKKELNLSRLYLPMFIFLYGYILITLGICAFIVVNLGINFNKVESLCFAMFISIMIATTFISYAKKRHFVENKLAIAKPKSDTEMKKYITHNALPKLLIFCSYPLIAVIICYLLEIFIFHKD